MRIVLSSNRATAILEPDLPGETVELVRGKEEALIEQLNPLVLAHPVTLDMRAVQRIDAAGIATLISLYCIARQAGHCFTICRATPRVEEILLLVGLERMIICHEAAQPCPELALSAA
jgi:anti-anti-sigma factor